MVAGGISREPDDDAMHTQSHAEANQTENDKHLIYEMKRNETKYRWRFKCKIQFNHLDEAPNSKFYGLEFRFRFREKMNRSNFLNEKRKN